MCLVNILLSDIDLYTFITLGCSRLSSVGVNTYVHPKFDIQRTVHRDIFL